MTDRARRVFAIDVLRGVAVLGILLINIEDFGLPHADKSAIGTEWIGAYFPAVFTDHLGAWCIFRALFEGKMRAIFSMLFGAAAVLLTTALERRGEGARAADIYYRRTLWLLAFGLAHAYLLWEGDILFGYAIGGLFLYPMRKLSARAAIVAGACLLALTVPRAAVVAHHRQELRAAAARAEADEAAGRPVAPRLRDARDDWEEIEDVYRPDTATLQAARDDYGGGYARLFLRRAELVMYAESSDYYGWAFFDTVGMMLIGIGLLRLGVLSAQRSRRFYLAMAAIGYGIGVPASALTHYQQAVHRFDPVAVAWLTAAYDPTRVAVALGHVAAVMLLVQAGRARAVTAVLASVGRMALTSYLAASLICTTLFNGYGLALFGRLGYRQLYAVVLGVWCVQTLFACLWLRRFRLGPAEWLWRSLTYWSRQPIRREREIPALSMTEVA
jgi:uncharacterized protein